MVITLKISFLILLCLGNCNCK